MLLNRKLTAALLLTFVAAGAAACSDDKSVNDVEAGDCVKTADAFTTSNITDLPIVDCTEDHEAEVLKIFTHSESGDFPGSDTLSSEALTDCTGQAFEDYTGTAYTDTAILVAPLTPTETSWSHGDRETICVMTLPDNANLTQSLKDHGDDFPFEGQSHD